MHGLSCKRYLAAASARGLSVRTSTVDSVGSSPRIFSISLRRDC